MDADEAWCAVIVGLRATRKAKRERQAREDADMAALVKRTVAAELRKCDGRDGGLPTRPCAITGTPVHRGADHSFTCTRHTAVLP